MSVEKAGSPASVLYSKPMYRYALLNPGSAALATSGNSEGMVVAMQNENMSADERVGRIWGLQAGSRRSASTWLDKEA
jgi:hypothetical protein